MRFEYIINLNEISVVEFFKLLNKFCSGNNVCRFWLDTY